MMSTYYWQNDAFLQQFWKIKHLWWLYSEIVFLQILKMPKQIDLFVIVQIQREQDF